jgi:hypothetical protein
MARRIRRLVGVLSILAISTVALTATGSASRPRQADDLPVGVTEDTINIAYLYGDTSGLQESGLIAFTGDGGEQFSTFADLVNEAGGAGGRQLNVTTHQWQVPSTATTERPACVAATEDDQAFIVVFQGGQSEETLLCVTDEHETIAIAIASTARKSAYTASEGRLFTNDMNADRLMRNWVKAAKKQGLLKGATIGIVRPDVALHETVSATLTKELDKAGFEVADEVALPCEGQSCQQADVGAQRLQSSGVDTVFSLLPAIPYPSFVGAAGTIGYTPQYLSSDFEFQVYDTTLQFFRDVAESYEGAFGVGTTIEITEPDQSRLDCNAQWEGAGKEAYDFEEDYDAWSNVGTNCHMVQRIVAAIDAAEEGGGLTQESFIAAFEKLPVEEGERKGSYTKKKHDGFNTYQAYTFGADCVCWQSVEGSQAVDKKA